MADELIHPDEANWVTEAATASRLIALALFVLLCVAAFAIREAITWPNPIPDDLTPKQKADAEELRTVPDARLGYSSTKLHQYFTAIGPRGRDLYASTQLTLDLCFPFSYGALFVGLLARILPCRTRWVWVPGCMEVADVGENVLLTILASNFSATPGSSWETTARVAAGFTIAKWLFAAIGCGVGVVALGFRIRDCCRK